MAGGEVRVGDVTLRSLTRVATPLSNGRLGHVLPIVEALDEAGFATIDVWGDLSVAQTLKWLNESPWERLRTLCARLNRTTPQMCLAGACLVGLKPRSEGIVREFIGRAAACGVRCLLIYEPLNDVELLERGLAIGRAAGVQVSLGVVHPDGHNDGLERTAALVRRLVNLQPDGVCVKTGGVLGPVRGRILVEALRPMVPMRLELDLDNAGGIGGFTAGACAVAGADVIYASTAGPWLDPGAVPLSAVMATLRDVGIDHGLDSASVAEAAHRFASLRNTNASSLVDRLGVSSYWPEVVELPAGVLPRLAVRLEEQGALERLREAVSEVLLIRAEMGAEALVGPLVELAATQAVLNVLYGRRWQVVPDEMRDYLRGAYGRPSRPISPEVLLGVLGEPATREDEDAEIPAVAEPPLREDAGLKESEAMGGSRPEPVGNVLTSAAASAALGSTASEESLLLELAPEEARAFLASRETLVRLTSEFSGDEQEQETVPGLDSWERFGPEELRQLVSILETSEVEELTIETAGAKVSLRKAASPSTPVGGLPMAPAGATGASASPGSGLAPAHISDLGGREEAFSEEALAEGEVMVKAPMVGTFYRGPSAEAPPFVVQGQRVAAGDPLCILEAMKLLNEVVAEVSGVVGAILVEDGAPVEYGQPLFILRQEG